MHSRLVRSLLLASLAAALRSAPAAAAPPSFTATEMMKLGRVADPQLSPDGALVAYALTEIDLAAAARNTDLWLAPVSGATSNARERRAASTSSSACASAPS